MPLLALLAALPLSLGLFLLLRGAASRACRRLRAPPPRPTRTSDAGRRGVDLGRATRAAPSEVEVELPAAAPAAAAPNAAPPAAAAPAAPPPSRVEALREAAAAEEATERERASMAQAVAPALSAWAEGKDLVHLLATLDDCPLAVVAELALLEKVGGARRVGGNVAAERDVTKAYHAAVRALHADRRASTAGLAPERSVEADELLKLLTAAHGQSEWRRYWS